MKQLIRSLLKKRGAVFQKAFQQSGQKHGIDRWLLLGVLLLTCFGILMVYDSSVAIAMRDFSDQYYFVKEQMKWLGLGFIALGVGSVIDYRIWYSFALPLLVLAIVLLMAVFVPGLGINALGAHRWINLGFFVLQPAEFTKLVMAIYLSAWFSHPEKGRLLSFLGLLGFVVGLVMLEPDLGTSVILVAIAICLYFFSGASLTHFFYILPILLLSVGALALISPYRMQRLLTFINPQHDPLGSSYQIRQVLIGLGSGGWFGVGIGQSRQKYEYLPEANTDAIFAIIGEEIGFIGAVGVLAAFLFVLWRGFMIAKRTTHPFGKLLALGIVAWIGIQTIINLSAMVALIPLTGVPLPFISYGGSSLIVMLSGVGILLNISKHT